MEIDHSPLITGHLFRSLSPSLEWVGVTHLEQVTNLMEIHLEGNMTNQIVFSIV